MLTRFDLFDTVYKGMKQYEPQTISRLSSMRVDTIDLSWLSLWHQ